MRVRYSQWDPDFGRAKTLDDYVRLFMKLVNLTGGNANQALQEMKYVGQRHKLFDGDITWKDFVNELEERGLIQRRENQQGEQGRAGKRSGKGGEGGADYELTKKGEDFVRKDAFDEIFTALRRDTASGDHALPHGADRGGEPLPETRPYEWGDAVGEVDFRESLRNAAARRGYGDIGISEEDMVVHQREQMTSCATVLAIDISHSMVLYGEDRITPARTLALALVEYIHRNFPKDSIDVVLFGDEAHYVPISQLPYINYGHYHTNTKAALEMGQSILRTKRQINKQIILITDGKPSAIHEAGGIYKNPFGLDQKIVNQTINEAVACRRHNIVITTFMITSDDYLKSFIEELTKANKGRAYYASLDKLGSFVFEDYVRNKKRRF
jgi:Ca-activated chloride channel family protein